MFAFTRFRRTLPYPVAFFLSQKTALPQSALNLPLLDGYDQPMPNRGMVAVLALAASACGGSELTCELLEDETNCWASAAAAAAECLPLVTEVGVLQPDRASCTFSDGTVVVFDTPLPNDTSDLERLGFTIETNGVECARFVDTFENRMELTADGQTVVSELHSGQDFHLHCPDGTDYEAAFDLLFTCPGGTAPTDGFSVTATQVEFYIVSVATPGPLFTCAM